MLGRILLSLVLLDCALCLGVFGDVNQTKLDENAKLNATIEINSTNVNGTQSVEEDFRKRIYQTTERLPENEIENKSQNLTPRMLLTTTRNKSETENKSHKLTPGMFLTTTRNKSEIENESAKVSSLLRKARIEVFKRQLLSKLKMHARPDPAVLSKIKLPIPIIKGEVMGMRNRNRPSRIHKKERKRLILLPSHVEPSCKVTNNDPSSCIFFKFAKNISPLSVSSAVLWVYKLPDAKDASGNQTFVLSELKGTQGKRTKGRINTVHESLFVKSGWIQIDIRRLLQKWLFRKNVEHGMDISCKTCARNSTQSPLALDAAYRPFLVVHTEGSTDNLSRPRTTRGKRSTCSPSKDSCCLRPFEVSVSELGWDDWIIHPDTFQANECSGKCDSSNPFVPVKSVRYRILREFGYKPCCGVSKMSYISVLFFNMDGTAVQNSDIKLVAESCDCT